MSAPTLVVLNGRAGRGKALSQWPRIEPLLGAAPGELRVLRPASEAEAVAQARAAWAEGLRRVISVGGDGTTRLLLHALMPLAQGERAGSPLVFGVLPAGTGNAWARSQRLPLSLPQAAQRLARARPRPVDLAQIEVDGGRSWYLSVASAGIGGEIARRANLRRKHALSYLLRAPVTLLQQRPWPMRVEVDGRLWREGRFWLVAIANCSSFGSGMFIAPQARVDDGLFDIVLAEDLSRLHALLVFPLIYPGMHLRHPRVHHCRGSEVRITGERLPMEHDGEARRANEIVCRLLPGALQMLD